MMKLDDLVGKNVLITGAGQNIGRSIALEFAGQGSNVYYTDLNNDRVIKLREELEEFGVDHRGYTSDVSKKEDNDYLVNNLVENRNSIDILVNNVGISDKDPDFSNFNPDLNLEIYNTNVNGPKYLTKLVFNKMMKRKEHGSVLFLSSIHEEFIRRFSGYSESKGAIKMLVRELTLQLAPYNIRVNAIAPGYIELDKHGNPLEHEDTPLHQTSIDPKYIARTALVLSSEYFSRHTTGSTVTVDGGLSRVNHLFYEHPPGKNDDLNQ